MENTVPITPVDTFASEAPVPQPPIAPTMPPHNPVRAAALCVASLLLFACMDTTTKYLAQTYQIPFIMAVRYLGNLLLMVLILAPREGRRLFETQRTGLVVVRAIALASASLCFGSALTYMPVAETTAINFLAPIVVVAVAGRALGERVGWLGWIAALLGFAGVLLIARPGGGLAPLGVAFALGAAASNGLYQFLSRLLASTERTVALLFYTSVGGTILFGLAAPWFWPAHTPTPLEMILLASLGVYGGLAHFLFTAAFRHAPASLLAPLNYLQLLWAGLLGWIVFDHVPDQWAMAGMAIIAVSGAMVALRTRKPQPKRSA